MTYSGLGFINAKSAHALIAQSDADGHCSGDGTALLAFPARQSALGRGRHAVGRHLTAERRARCVAKHDPLGVVGAPHGVELAREDRHLSGVRRAVVTLAHDPGCAVWRRAKLTALL